MDPSTWRHGCAPHPTRLPSAWGCPRSAPAHGFRLQSVLKGRARGAERRGSRRRPLLLALPRKVKPGVTAPQPTPSLSCLNRTQRFLPPQVGLAWQTGGPASSGEGWKAGWGRPGGGDRAGASGERPPPPPPAPSLPPRDNGLPAGLGWEIRGPARGRIPAAGALPRRLRPPGPLAPAPACRAGRG